MRRMLLLVVLPLVLLGPTVFQGKLFLPQHPLGFEPLAAEHPDDAARVWRDANYLASDRLFPIATDELEIQRQLRAGRLPLWNGKQGLGLPLLGGTLVGACYPPNWIGYATDPIRAAPWLAMLSLFLCGLGAWLFLERRELSFAAAAIGALAAQASGFVLTDLHYRMKVDAAAWFPWMLWAIEGLRLRAPRASLALALSVALSFLAGFPSIAIFSCGAALCYAVARRFLEGERELPLGRTLVLVLLGTLIAGVQLAPTWDASRASLRAPKSAAELDAEALPLATSLSIVAPDPFGAPNEPTIAPHLPVPWWLTQRSEADAAQNANLLEWNLFSGLGVFALALAGWIAFPRTLRSLGFIALLALAFAQGWPVARWLYAVPGLNLGAPSRASAVLAFALALAAGFGAEALLRANRRALTATLATALAALAVGAWARWVLDPSSFAAAREAAVAARHGVTLGEVRALFTPQAAIAAAERWRTIGERMVVVALALAIGALIAFRTARRASALAGSLPLFAVLLVESATFAAPHLAPRDAFEFLPKSPAMDAIAKAAGDGRVLRLDESADGVGDVLRLARPNLVEAYGIADLTPYVAFSQRALVELVGAIDPIATYRTGISRISYPGLLDHRLLDRCRVTAILSRARVAHPRLEPVFERESFFVYRRTGSLAFARLVPNAVATASDDEVIGLVRQSSIDPAQAVILEPGEHSSLSRPASAAPFEGEVQSASDDRMGSIDCSVRAPSGGWLALSVAFHPGWRATIDGRPARVACVDHAFLAVELPPNSGAKIELRFAPASFRIGLGLTLGALLALFFVARAPRAR